jgi:hypothetical protein
MSHPGSPVLRVVGPGDLDRQLAADAVTKADAAAAARTGQQPELTGLAGYIRGQFDMMKQHRNMANEGWSERLLKAMRVFNGVYDPTKRAQIAKFGGSDVYAKVISMKCRGASALLRDVYLSPDRAWGVEPPDDPTIPPEIMQSIQQLVQGEMSSMQAAGQPANVTQIRDRTNQLIEAARDAAKKQAKDQASIAEDKIDTILKEGGFYKAISEFLVDLPLFPFACIKGPIVRIVPTVTWAQGKALVVNKAKLFWNRISPFDIWFTPGVADIEDAEVIERTKLTRADLNDLLDLPGYNVAAIRQVLDLYGRGGLSDNWDSTDSERAVLESRENPTMNRSGLISCLEYTGNVQGRMLIEYGMNEKQIPDPMRDYYVQAWLIGRYVIKAQLSPSPRKRHNYFITSFEKVPGTPVGNGLPDTLNDVEDVCNATLRSLVNNLSISSGPQVTVNDDRLAPDEDGEDMYPWKRWHVTTDPMGQSATVPPIGFFQPQSNAQELLGVYTAFVNLADDLSGIPKYLQGGSSGGAGRTASGLAMLMGNASKIMQTVASNIDRDIYEPALGQLFDMIMLTDTSGLLNGEEKVRVLGVNVAVQKETQRARQLEFLQTTNNPIDMQIMGPMGRAEILRAVSGTIGLDGTKIVPSDQDLQQQAKQSQQLAAQNNQPGHAMAPADPEAPGGPTPGPSQGNGGSPPGSAVSGTQGPQTSIAGGAH